MACLYAWPPRLPVAGAHVTPLEGGRRLAVTVTSQRGVAVDRDRPIAMLDFSVSLVLKTPRSL